MLFLKTISTVRLAITFFVTVGLTLPSFAQKTSHDSIPVHTDSITSNLKNYKPLVSELLKTPDLKKLFLGRTAANSLISTTKSGINSKIDSYKSLFREISADVNKKINNPFSVDKGSVSLFGIANTSNQDSLANRNYNLFDANASGSLAGIPYSILYQNHYYPFLPDANQNRFTYQYDKEAYLNQIKKKLAGKFNPEDFLENFKDPVQQLKTAAEKALHNELNELKMQYKDLLDDKVKQLGNIEDLFFKDINTIRQSLVNNKWTEEIQSKSAMLAQLQTQINTGVIVNMEEFNTIKNELKKYKGTEDLLNTIQKHSKRWQESGLLKKIKESGLVKQDMINKVINDPAIIRKMAKQKLDLNGIQRLFLSVTKLNVGQGTADLSRMLTNNSIMHGLNTGFQLNSKKSLNLLAGNLKTFNSLLDMPFTNSVYNNNNRMVGLQLQNAMSGGNNSAISMMAFQTFSDAQFPSAVTVAPRRSMVLGISRQVEINKANNLQVELSKSSAFYNSEINADSSNAHVNLLNSQDFFKSVSATLNYNGEFENINMQADGYLRYAGINYDNPATAFVPNGTIEAAAGVRKAFLKKKRLQVYAKTNWRQYKFSEALDSRRINTNHFIDVKWKMKKGQSVSIRYQPVHSTAITNGIKSVNAATERLSASANVATKIRSISYRNYFTLSYQSNSYAYLNGGNVSNKSLQISSMQNFIIGGKMIYSNTSFNKVNDASAFIYYNTSFTTDLGMTYNIGKGISASSSLNYNSIQGWYQQVAVRQSLAGELGKKFKMDIYVDMGKNIKTIQPLPYGLFRAEWSVQYIFNR